MTPSNDFGVNLDGSSITELPVSQKDVLGVEINRLYSIPGNVSLYEEHDARIQAGYNLNEWYALSPEDRALEVAHYRVRSAISYQKSKKENQPLK